MKRIIFLLAALTLLWVEGVSQSDIDVTYESDAPNNHGKLNPNAPKAVGDYDFLIGTNECNSVARTPEQVWGEPQKMIWRWKYIMNGTAVQDETFRPGGLYAGSIRQYNADSAKWYVHYYSVGAPVPVLPAWGGEKQDNGDIILYREQKAPNGMDGYYKITFADMTEESFRWVGEWVDVTEKIVFPTWKIDCKKVSR